MFQNAGTLEIVIIVFVIILFFGSQKVPEFIQGVGEAIKELRNITIEEDK
jgi:TatA/E family protein of Tat protein translocase